MMSRICTKPEYEYEYGTQTYMDTVLLLVRVLRYRIVVEFSFYCFFVRFLFSQCNKKYGTQTRICTRTVLVPLPYLDSDPNNVPDFS